MAKFLNRLVVEELDCTSYDGRGKWLLCNDLSFQSDVAYRYFIRKGMSPDAAQAKSVITVPKGFATDFMSVPPEVPECHRLSRSRRAGTVHDYLYSQPHYIDDRDVCDHILSEMFAADVTECGGASSEAQRLALALECNLIYLGVHIGGSSHWA